MKVGDLVSYTKPCVGESPKYGDCGRVIEIKEIGKHAYLVDFGNKTWWCSDWEIELLGEQSKKEEGKKMAQVEEGRGLYEVNVVVPDEDGELLMEEKVVARDEAEAIFASKLKEILKAKGLKKGDVDILVRRIGTVRPYETIQNVKIVGKVDGFTLCKSDKN